MEDNTGKKCKKCGKGIYKETSQLDDLKGVLHCNKCGHEIDRYTGIKKFEDFVFENDKPDIDPYGEENWNGNEPVYNGNIIEFIKLTGDDYTKKTLNDLLYSDDLDDRMDYADQICMYYEEEYPDLYDQLEDDIKDLAIS